MPTTKQEITLGIQGLDCADCALTLEKGVAQVDGVSTCELGFTTQKMHVTGNVDREAIIARVRALGYDVVEPGAEADSQTETTGSPRFMGYMWQRNETRLALLGALLVLPGLLLDEILGMHHMIIDAASIGALITAGLPIARSAWRAVALSHEININVLMTIASIGAVIIGAYTEAGMVMVLFAIGEALEGYTANRARQAVRSLMQILPDEATVLRRHDGHVREERVKVHALSVGDVILVKPGERIPMDGCVLAGASSVNQAPITGESCLVEKVRGSRVFASSINGEGALKIQVSHLAADNTISRLIKMVQEAQEKRAPVQRFVDRFASYYTPAIVVLAVLVAAIPPLLLGQPLFNPGSVTSGWLYRGLALLVVGCPCALVISTPVSIISAISNAARNGVLIKGGAHLEALSRVDAVAFDKTGTLTAGQPAVVTVRSTHCAHASHPDYPAGETRKPAQGMRFCDGCNDLLALASAVEQHSEHPIARAILNETTRTGLQDQYPTAESVTALTGRGVTGQVAGRQVTIGSHNYFDAHVAHSRQDCARANRDVAQGYTPMMVSADGQYLGTITVADTVRASSQEAVAMLKQAGLKALVMLTGDNAVTAQKVGTQVGVTAVQAELLPEHKVSAVEALRQQYRSVAMVGDGINDAPALATADVGIAIGGAAGGTAQAMETADITLMSDDLRQLAFAFRLSQAAMRTIRVNVGLSLGIKLAFLALVLAGRGSMWVAVLADVGTSLLVTFNGMRLLRRPTSVISEV